MSRGYAAIGLFNPKHPENIGSALRAAHAFGAAMVTAQGRRYKRCATDTSAAYRHLPLITVPDLRAVVPYDCVPVAVELTDDAVDLATYRHPHAAFYVFGPEDGSIPDSVLGWCRDVVRIPTALCLNLAGAVHCVLYDRAAKQVQRAAAVDAELARLGVAS